MEENDVMQEPQNEGNDSFLGGWEEPNSGQEEAAPGGDGGKQAGDQGESQAGEDGAPQDGGSGQPEGEAGGQSDGAAQPESGAGGEESPPASENGQQPPPPPPKTWTVDYMGQTVTVSEADVPGLAQRALDYDRVRSAYEEARPVMDLFRGFAQRAGVPVQEYVARLRTQAKQMEGLNEAAARRAVEMEDREARVSIKEEQERARQEAFQRAQAAQRQRHERVQADVQEFISVFPNAARDFNSIPKEVWDSVNGGMSLVAAYAQYSNAQAQASAQAAEEEQRRQEAVRKQNEQNAAASAGSMKSAGNNHGPKDPFMEGWDE